MVLLKLSLAVVCLCCVTAADTPHGNNAPSVSPPENAETTAPVLVNTKGVMRNDSSNGKQNETSKFSLANLNIGMKQANGVVLRAFYVIVGIMLIILVYFVVRIARSRYRRSKTRRYGIIATRAAELEMQPLDRLDDDEEETTLFEANKR